MQRNRIAPAAIFLALAWTACLTADLYGAEPSNPEDRCLAALASPTASIADKAAACRDLRVLGTEKSVPALAALLADKELSHSARIALEPMAYPAAGAAPSRGGRQDGGPRAIGPPRQPRRAPRR